VGKSSKLEKDFRDAVSARGYHFESNCRDLPGTPDIVFRTCRIAIFVHGCFWHQHAGCPNAPSPKKAIAKWTAALNATVLLDGHNAVKFQVMGWKRLVFWECEIRNLRTESLDRVCAAVDTAEW